jgi:hypothetical protein
VTQLQTTQKESPTQQNKAKNDTYHSQPTCRIKQGILHTSQHGLLEADAISIIPCHIRRIIGAQPLKQTNTHSAHTVSIRLCGGIQASNIVQLKVFFKAYLIRCGKCQDKESTGCDTVTSGSQGCSNGQKHAQCGVATMWIRAVSNKGNNMCYGELSNVTRMPKGIASCKHQ